MQPFAQSPLFPGAGVPPQLADWHAAFDALSPAHSALFELWFDRGPYTPVVEMVRLPLNQTRQDTYITALYLSVLINNILCIYGAKRVSIVSSTAYLHTDILAAIEKNLFFQLHSFSNMSMDFLHTLIWQVFQTTFSLDTDQDHAAALRASLHQSPAAEEDRQPIIYKQRLCPQKRTVLSINIGQRLTSWGIVELHGDSRYSLEHFARLTTQPTEDDQNFGQSFEGLLDSVCQTLGKNVSTVDAVGISIAVTVVGGVIQPVQGFGVFTKCPLAENEDVNALIRRLCQSAFPGRPVTICNDAEAQALFTFHAAGGREALVRAGAGSHLLSLRLGACSCVQCLDINGNVPTGFHEYGWFITTLNTNTTFDHKFSTIRLYLSYYGVAIIAHELGLLEKYNVLPESALPFFYEQLFSEDPTRIYDAECIYAVLGAHIAMFAAEINRRRPLATVVLLGSRANKINELVFSAMQDGFEAFFDKHPLVAPIEFVLIEDASAQSGLVGVAYATLRRAPA